MDEHGSHGKSYTGTFGNNILTNQKNNAMPLTGNTKEIVISVIFPIKKIVFNYRLNIQLLSWQGNKFHNWIYAIMWVASIFFFAYVKSFHTNKYI